MAETTERFIPLHILISPLARDLSPRQRELIELHRSAKKDQNAVEDVANAITLKSLYSSKGNMLKTFRDVARTADASTDRALSAAVKYYHNHGRAEQAFNQLRKFADRHWSSPLDWTEAFRRHAIRHSVTFTPGLLRKIRQYETEMDAYAGQAKRLVQKYKAKSGGGLN